MDVGILRALQTVRANPYINYVGLGLAGLVSQKDHRDPVTGEPLRKTKLQLVRISAAVCGIELCYAAETAFVSPILLKLGVPTTLMTMVWCLSPLLGFFLVPIMGSLSDRCRFRIGRRRPFIIVMAMGIVLGLALVPNGEALGRLLGDSGNMTKLGHPKSAAAPPYKDVTTTSEAMKLRFGEWKPNRTEESEGRGRSSAKPDSSAQTEVRHGFSAHKPKNASTPYGNRRIYRSKPSRTKMATNATRKVTDASPSAYQFSPSSSLSFTIPSHGVRGIILTIVGVAMLDFNCDACQSPSRAYLLDVSVPEDHQTGLTTFTVMAGLGGTVGYLMGGIDWNATSFGEALGGHIRVVFTIVLVSFIIFIISTLTSFRETPLDQLDIRNEDVVKKIKKRKDKKKYQRFTNEEDSWSDENEGDDVERSIEAMKRAKQDKSITFYGSLSDSNHCSKLQHQNQWLSPDTQNGGAVREHCQEGLAHQNDACKLFNGETQLSSSRYTSDNPGIKTFDEGETKYSQNGNDLTRMLHNKNGALSHAQTADEINPYSKSASNMSALTNDVMQPAEVDDIKVVEVSTDVTLRTYLRSIVHMPGSLWVLCVTNLFCWMSLLCYSLYFTDFVGQSVFGGDPAAPIGSDLHNRYDAGVRMGSWGMSLYSFSCSCYSLVIEKLVLRFRAKPVYVCGQLAYSIGMVGMALTRTKWAVLLFSPTAGIMYATLFTMPYMLVAHYHTRGLFNTTSGSDSSPVPQVRGLGTDVAIVSSMVFMAQFLLSVAMGTIMAAVGSTVTVLVASSVLSFCGAVTALSVTYLDL